MRQLAVTLWVLIAIAVFGAGAGYAARRYLDRAPYVARDVPGFDRCAEQRGAGCPGRLLTIRNPGTRAARVTVGCPVDARTATTVVVGPGGSAQVDLGVGWPWGLGEGDCRIVRWR